ncbi:MAG: hypothetical protein SVY15_02050 [Halobacteriota archaeon]|nr:hypothetical protein [Halobacteriota archaeon]
MGNLIRDEGAQSILIEYIMIASITLLFTGGVYMTVGDMIVDSTTQSMTEQYADIGNEISGTMNSMYLSGISNGTASKRIKIPVYIADDGYRIDVNVTDQYGRQSIKISSMYNSDAVTYIPLNNLTERVNVSGTIYSGSGEIVISYDTTQGKIELN